MSLVSVDFDWDAPVPQVFTRTEYRYFWPGDRRYLPLLFATRFTRDLRALIQALPPELTPILRERFKPTRGPMRWRVPPSLPLSLRQRYDERLLGDRSAIGIRSEVCVTAGTIERLLNTEEGLMTGLAHNFLFVMQMIRLRQLWQEVQRRAWDEDPLVIFKRALG